MTLFEKAQWPKARGKGERNSCVAMALACVCMLASLCLLSMGNSALAQNQRRAVVIIDSGDTDLMVESLVRAIVESELQSASIELVQNFQVGGDTPSKLLACAGNLECTLETLQGIDSEEVVFVSIRSNDSDSIDIKIVARHYEVSTGSVLARVSKRCTNCDQESGLSELSHEVMQQLLEQGKKGTEKKALVSAPVTATESSIPKQTKASFQLNDSQAQKSSSSILPYSLLALGIVSLAGGTSLVFIDGPVIENGERQPERYDTLNLGYGGLGLGAALVGISAWLLVSDDDDASKSAHNLLPTTNGATYTFSGEF